MIEIYYTGDVNEIIAYCSASMPRGVTNVKFETGTLGLMEFNKLLENPDGAYLPSDRKDVVYQERKKFIIVPYGEIDLVYDGELDISKISSFRFRGLPLSSATVKVYCNEELFATFYLKI